MKLRINRSLYERLSNCARIVDESVADYVTIALKNLDTTLRDVAYDENLLSATSASVVATVPDGSAPAQLRLAIAKAVAYAEERNPAPYKCTTHFIIGNIH